ncbi:MAG TPA: hypothetical protein VLX59_18475 [Acidimicrobiales bacterium]|nr:hypothetical protein [Acidimicrobiales bacterium]
MDDIELGTTGRVDHFNEHERAVDTTQEPGAPGGSAGTRLGAFEAKSGGSSDLSRPHG